MINNIFVLHILLMCALVSVSGILKVNTETHQIIDQNGRERIFHGVNAVQKSFPYIPNTDVFDPCSSLSEQDFKNMKEWGLNAIRLGTMWPGVEPQKGFYNETYLNQLKYIVDTAGKYGIYTLLDMHQDLFSEKFCGDGIPLWLIPEAEYKYFPLPIPKKIEFNNQSGLPMDCNITTGWGTYYFSYDVAEGFEKLYTNYEGRLNLMAQFWGKIAQTFKGNPFVLGYELINEPFAGNIFKNPLLLIPGFADRLRLQDAYEIIAQEIRKYDEDHIIFFEPVTWDNMIKVGFTQPPGGNKYSDRSVLAYHYYNPPDFAMGLFFNERNKDIQRLNVGGFLTEFFVSGGSFAENQKVMDMCDKYNQGWLGWIYKPYADPYRDEGRCTYNNGTNGGFYYNNGTAVYEIVHTIVRTYASAIAGKSINQYFNNTSGEYQLEYRLCIECGQTEINYNAEHYYPQGFNIQISGNASYILTSDQVFVIPNSNSKNNEVISVKITTVIEKQIIE
ncbi:glycosyl hydrolase family cellulase (macronuclear) [Tetrahymena thermophila SB210]|uniref:Glycosyl hydrolase family cellulase n=1 Tax=Tetrahymena thermophila (strain SB210) TaxID=312017 RepID=I7M1X3_TETTS|nr:glycosyl hydrolase family cellulase [Tetrahymena thermophila SB210]EAR97960.1 glycosyl hydrolase family cellulase [Tetrahymena thermophila SB210]|eukprot:XP_001018205.1 glycosyl hydrolase family cellulase [Tetrahymena thermophila SB210]